MLKNRIDTTNSDVKGMTSELKIENTILGSLQHQTAVSPFCRAEGYTSLLGLISYSSPLQNEIDMEYLTAGYSLFLPCL